MAKCSRCGRLLGEAGMPSPDGMGGRLCSRCFRLELAITLMDQPEETPVGVSSSTRIDLNNESGLQKSKTPRKVKKPIKPKIR